MEKEIQADHAAGRLPWVSFKPPQAGAGRLAGHRERQLRH